AKRLRFPQSVFVRAFVRSRVNGHNVRVVQPLGGTQAPPPWATGQTLTQVGACAARRDLRHAVLRRENRTSFPNSALRGASMFATRQSRSATMSLSPAASCSRAVYACRKRRIGDRG